MINTRRGFTIVELLIVIVVIAILAAITIVAYNGVQSRADKAKQISAVAAARKALISYATVNGAYPSTSTYCIGENYPDLDSDGVGDCCISGSVVCRSYNVTANNLLKQYGGAVTQSTKFFTVGSYKEAGISYYQHGTATVDGKANPWFLFYVLEGNAEKCSNAIGGINLTGQPNFSSTPTTTASETWSDGVKCWYPLPDPKSL